jgi:hypothetical protein
LKPKPADKKTTKKSTAFFGDHLETKPAFMQRPQSLAEAMAAAFSPSTSTEMTVNTATNDNSPANTLAVDATETNLATPADLMTSEPITMDNLLATNEQPTTVANNASLAESARRRSNSTAVNPLTLAEQAIIDSTGRERLAAIVNPLKELNTEEWQPLDLTKVSDYWRGYALAWHYLEDTIVPQLEKDFKLALRYCYRQAFGQQDATGHFFAGQTRLAADIGVSKRRVQDLMETFHQLGWVVKTAHYNRRNLRGTEYAMRLPRAAQQQFYQ